MHRIYLPDRVEEAVLYTQLQEQTPLREPLLELPDFLPDIAMEAAGMTVALGLWGSSQAHAPSFTLAGNTSPTSWLLRGSLPPGHPRCVHAAMSEVEKWRGESDSSRSGGFLIPSSIDEKGPQTKDANIEASPLQGRSGDMLSPRDPLASQSHLRLGQFMRSRGRPAGISISKARALRFHYKNVKLSTRPACTHYHTPTTELYAKND
ncbi:hypothetical protein MJT46_018204 [Ovis ammon polii x Ovis aries]|nr:hypothetical protein MJT46_018204 [Ovis ammon polii x Ovis aries]